MKRSLWLHCRASKGQFTDELAIMGKDHAGEEFSFFVSQEFVEYDGDPNTGEIPARLRVKRLDSKDDLVLIQLPSQTFGNGSIITVSVNDLEAMECEPA